MSQKGSESSNLSSEPKVQSPSSKYKSADSSGKGQGSKFEDDSKKGKKK